MNLKEFFWLILHYWWSFLNLWKKSHPLQKDVISLSGWALIPPRSAPFRPSAICQSLKYPGSSESRQAVALCDSLWNLSTSSQVWLDTYHRCVLLLADAVTFYAINRDAITGWAATAGLSSHQIKFSQLSMPSFTAFGGLKSKFHILAFNVNLLWILYLDSLFHTYFFVIPTSFKSFPLLT